MYAHAFQGGIDIGFDERMAFEVQNAVS